MPDIQLWPEWYFVRELGSGSYGKVYEIHRRNGDYLEKAALKVIQIPSSPGELEQLRMEGVTAEDTESYLSRHVEEIRREIGLMQQFVGYSNIVSYEDYMIRRRSSGIGWDILIRMELLSALSDYMVRNMLTEDDVLQIGLDISQALVICHGAGIIHRDIKPQNIFINDRGFYKLGDFGISRSMPGSGSVLSFKGTVSYMAPETFSMRNTDARSDIYSLALVLYRILNGGREPFLPTSGFSPAERDAAQHRRLSGEPLPRPAQGSEALCAVLATALAPDPAARYQTAAQFNAALQKAAAMSSRQTGHTMRYVQPDGTYILQGNTYQQQGGAYSRQTGSSVRQNSTDPGRTWTATQVSQHGYLQDSLPHTGAYASMQPRQTVPYPEAYRNTPSGKARDAARIQNLPANGSPNNVQYVNRQGVHDDDRKKTALFAALIVAVFVLLAAGIWALVETKSGSSVKPVAENNVESSALAVEETVQGAEEKEPVMPEPATENTDGSSAVQQDSVVENAPSVGVEEYYRTARNNEEDLETPVEEEPEAAEEPWADSEQEESIDNGIVEFPDTALENAVRAALGIQGRDITVEDTAGRKVLDLSGEGKNSDRKISDLTGLSAFSDLEELRLNDNRISDISELAALTDLKELYLEKNYISDLEPLAGLSNLRQVELRGNTVSDISPLSFCTGLKILDFRENVVEDISAVQSMPSLRQLVMSDNRIESLEPVKNAHNLWYLSFNNNPVEDLTPLRGLDKLTTLCMSGTKVRDIRALMELPALGYVDLSNCSRISSSAVKKLKERDGMRVIE